VPRTNNIPAPPRHEVRRRQLTTRVTASLVARLTLVSGPAGSGKTTGVAQWARAITTPVVWLALDEDDDDVRRFRSRLLDAFPNARRTPDDRAIADGLTGLRDETVLVCDGIDALEDPVTLAELNALCVDGPPALHVLLVGRAVPALSGITRLRLAGDLNEITADDLDCQPDEAAALLEVLGVALDEPDRAELLERTEGLIAAVALAGVLARGHDKTRAVARFGGATDEFAQYLYAEVIDRLTVDVFGFMLATSVLDVLEPAACDEITGRSDSRVLLADLARRHVLTESIDGGSAYRYHRLLHEFLRAELRRSRPERWRALHRFWGGAVTSVAQWTAILPKPSDAIDITRALDMALTLILTGDVEGGLDWLHLVETEIALGDADHDTLGRRAYIDYLIAFARGDLLRAARQATNARQLLTATTWSWDELRAPFGHAQLQTLLGRPGRARATIAEYVARFNPVHKLDGVALPGLLSEAALSEGLLNEAEAHARQAIEAANGLTDPDFWFAVQPYYVVGAVLLERNRLEEARVELEHATAIGAKQGFAHAALLPLLSLARVQHLSGDGDLARTSLASARRLLRRRSAVPLQQRIEETEAAIALADHDYDRARVLVDTLHDPCRTRVAARLELEMGRFEEAHALLSHAASTSVRDRIDVLLMRAHGADDETSLDLVAQALTLAEPEGYVRIFVDEAPWLAAYVRRLVGAWPSGFAAAIAAAIVAEPDRRASLQDLGELSGREQEVWRFLSTSLSMQEIADALYVSRNTLKSHVRSIYRKLGVSTREDAVGRGNGLHRADV
jgi:LuxR family transcriptional regulator, maltose regulon positive regulatory protein